MRTADVVAFFGSIKKTCSALECTRASIYQWGDHIPPAREYEVEVKSLGKLQSRFTLERLKEERRRQGDK